ncbi:MAG: TraB/GumN family protein [Bacteroidia bacterium]|nr:TraB/GumN family protein [Bacteroidia bacterium]
MNSIKYFVGGVLLVLLATTACKSAKKVNELATKPDNTSTTVVNPDNSLIWTISGGDLKEESYLYGTIHVIGDNDFFYPKGTEEGFQKAKHLMLELDFDEPGLMMKIAMSAMMKDKTLKDLLDEDQYSRFKSFLKDTLKVSGMESMAAERMKPVLGMGLAYPKMINGKMVSYEETFAKMAKKQDMGVSGLEEVDDQIAALNQISMDDQLSMLMEMVDSFQVQKKLFGDMVELYKKQDLSSLFNMMAEYEEVSNVQADLLDARNERWIPKIIEQAKVEPTFIAVGAAHLYGEKGVISLLRKEGLTVKPIPQQ